MPGQDPTIIGPYRLIEPLGRGGMGTVWRAEHRETGQPAALKTVHLPNEILLASFRREIHALARIRHPGVVRILEQGVHEGLPWYAMELLDGRTLRLHCKTLRSRRLAAEWIPAEVSEAPTGADAPTRWMQTPTIAGGHKPLAPSEPLVARATPGPLRASPPAASVLDPGLLGELLTLLRRLCAPLAYLHGEGIVHRDLKPDNILVAASGWPVIVDFGLAAPFAGPTSRESLDWSGDTAGTVAYMAPEQIRGELVDARADLYSLGCILYELLTEHTPFPGISIAEIAMSHLHRAPEPPSRLAPSLPAEIDALVLRLLRKDPRERPGHAGDVAQALEQLGAESGPAVAQPKARTYLYRPGFGGRQHEIERLERVLGGLTATQGAVVMVGGESGIGKTRLVLELARRAKVEGVQVLLGESQPPGQEAGPLAPLRRPLQGIADRCRTLGLAETRRLLGRRGKVLAAYEPDLRDLPGQDLYPEPAPLAADAARVRLYSDLLETLEALAAAAPVLLVLDDLQWADELTSGFLEHFLRAGMKAALLIVGTYRIEEVGAGHASPLQRLIEAQGLVRIVLGRLEEAAVGTMVGRMLALEPAPAALSAHLARLSEGNPFFVAEYLRAAVDENLLRRDAQGCWQVTVGAQHAVPADAVDPMWTARLEALELPHSLRDLVERRLADLPAQARAVLDVVSVLGRESAWPVLERMTGTTSAGVDELLRRHVLEEARDPGGAPVLRFAHDKLREIAYDRLAPQQRAELHRRAAESLESASEDRREALLAALGHHWEEAGELIRAGACYREAAVLASDHYAHAEAERLYRAYLRLTPQATPQSVRVRTDLGFKVLRLQGRNAEAIAELTLAVEQARRLGERSSEARARASLGWLSNMTGGGEAAAELCREALRIACEIGDREAEAAVRIHLGLIARFHGHLDEALALMEPALVLHRQLGDRRTEMSALTNFATLFHDMGRPEQSIAFTEKALAIARQLGDRSQEASLLGNLGVMHALEARLQETALFYEQSLALIRETGDRRGEGIMLSNLAHLRIDMGGPELARQLYSRALLIHRAVGETMGQARVLFETSRLERLCPQAPGPGAAPADPGQLAWQAEALTRQMGNPQNLGLSLVQLGHLELSRGQSAGPLLAELRPLTCSLHLQPKSELAQALGRLERAQLAFEAGEPWRLFRGELVEAIPEGLRLWLIQNGRLQTDGL